MGDADTLPAPTHSATSRVVQTSALRLRAWFSDQSIVTQPSKDTRCDMQQPAPSL
jgi:hypothetical protein